MDPIDRFINKCPGQFLKLFSDWSANQNAVTSCKTFTDYDDSDGHIGSFSPAYGDQYPDIIITDDSYDSSYDLEDIDVQYT